MNSGELFHAGMTPEVIVGGKCGVLTAALRDNAATPWPMESWATSIRRFEQVAGSGWQWVGGPKHFPGVCARGGARGGGSSLRQGRRPEDLAASAVPQAGIWRLFEEHELLGTDRHQVRVEEFDEELGHLAGLGVGVHPVLVEARADRPVLQPPQAAYHHPGLVYPGRAHDDDRAGLRVDEELNGILDKILRHGFPVVRSHCPQVNQFNVGLAEKLDELAQRLLRGEQQAGLQPELPEEREIVELGHVGPVHPGLNDSESDRRVQHL